MADQTTVSGNGRSTQRPSVTRNMGGVAHDILMLAELQFQLLLADLKESVSRVVWPSITIVGGLVLALGSVPVLLFGIAYLLVAYDLLPLWAALLATAGAAIAVSGAAAWLGWSKLRQSFTTLQRSQDELVRNINWIKRVLKDQP